MREDLINSALSFLSDPKVQDAPLTKKVSFLESKGMTSEEIEEAMVRANGKSTASAQTAIATTGTMAQQPIMVQKPPPVPVRPSYDWKDVFIGAVLAGGIGYGAWTLAKRLYATWFQVPSQKEIDQDKDKLDAQFQAVEDSLKEIKDGTNAALINMSEQSKKVDDSINNLSQVLEELEKSDKERDNEFNDMKKEIDTLQTMVSKTLETNKNMQSASLIHIQNDIKSLKSFMLNRRETPMNTPSTPQSSSSIPAWQLTFSNGK